MDKRREWWIARQGSAQFEHLTLHQAPIPLGPVYIDERIHVVEIKPDERVIDVATVELAIEAIRYIDRFANNADVLETLRRLRG